MKIFNLAALLTVAVVFATACDQSSNSDKKKPSKAAEDDSTPPASPTTVPGGPGGSDGADGSKTEVPEGTKMACWDQLLKTPEAVACKSLYTYSGKVCVAGLTKVATCTRESIAAVYGSATLKDQPVMTTVDQWIADGYAPNQCATGPDGKLYAYFLKKVFTPGETTVSPDTYAIADKKLGPGGATLDSIVLQTTQTPTPVSCE